MTTNPTPTQAQIEALIEVAADKLIAGQRLTRAERRLLESPQGDFAMGQVRAALKGKDHAKR